MRTNLFMGVILAVFLAGCQFGGDDDSDDEYRGDYGSGTPGYQLLAWNDLGMHCMDADYAVFSILPPYNTLVAQLVRKDREPARVTDGVSLTFESVPSLEGSRNTTSVDKTNFWEHVRQLFGSTLEPDVGLKGVRMPGATPQPLTYDEAHDWWIAEGIPITPRDDDGTPNSYPMVKVVARDEQGIVLAETTAVLPVSDEMDCRVCHASRSGYDEAKPAGGWVNDPNPERDYRFNILRLHDENYPDAVSSHQSALATKGWHYDVNGLEATATGGTAVLCAACHVSNALPGTGVVEISPLTRAMHAGHAQVTDPRSGKVLDDSTNRDACYLCHPGETTQCLRGAMGKAKNADGTSRMQCQSCHGTMSAVGDPGREGWFDQPDCQSCHQEGRRYSTAVVDMATGALRPARDQRFATNPDTPMPGKSLYRFSTGHGGLQCSACHGSTHAIYPSSKEEDNIQSIAAQGYAGTIRECTSCHTTVPLTETGGPHGMHTLGQHWVDEHEEFVEDTDPFRCTACHGDDYRGSPLSATGTARTYQTEWGTKRFPKGHQVSCYDCHDGPYDD